jgi:aspartate/glutamate racemase
MSKISQWQDNSAVIGIIMLDTTFPRIVGDVGNPETFDFPVIYHTVKNATPKRVVIEADHSLLKPFIDAGRSLVESGAKIISTSCGFLSIFQRQLQQALPVPVLTSSLLQAHMAQTMISTHQKIGILTAHSQALTHDHLAGVGIQEYPLVIAGMEHTQEFAAVFIEGKHRIDVERCRQEMVAATADLINTHPDIGALVLECTNMPPYTHAIQRIAKVPVFDVVTLLNYARAALSPSSS